MLGNVGEWCWDWFNKDQYKNDKTKEPVVDPIGAESGSSRVKKGFDFSLEIKDGLGPTKGINLHTYSVPTARTLFVGFRVCRTVVE